VADASFAAALGSAAAARTRALLPSADPARLGPEGRRFAVRFRARFGRSPGPYSVLGYDAMRLALQAIARAGDRGAHRAAVIRAFFAGAVSSSPRGPYRITASGDPTLGRWYRHRIRDGSLLFSGASG
jgi:branched-chain amino acid transport system substrate-binding protein